jgi:hypothetical protein
MRPENVRRFLLLFLIVFDSFVTGTAFAHRDYLTGAVGVVIVVTICAMLGALIYEGAE